MDTSREYQAKQVIVMRKDLNMRRGKQIAQGAHASLGAYKQMLKENPNDLAFIAWDTGRFAKICVSVDTEEELLVVYTKAKAAGLNVCLITDAGFTEFNGVPTNTCLCVGPAWREDVDKITGHLKLL